MQLEPPIPTRRNVTQRRGAHMRERNGTIGVSTYAFTRVVTKGREGIVGDSPQNVPNSKWLPIDTIACLYQVDEIFPFEDNPVAAISFATMWGIMSEATSLGRLFLF